MGNVMMYAYTSGVQNGSTVNLTFKPFSTVIEFTLTVPETYTSSQKQNITVQSLTLTAPKEVNIAGDFYFDFPTDGTPIVESISGSNSVTVHFIEDGVYSTVLSPEIRTLKAKMCLMPIDGVANLGGWEVKVETNAGSFTKSLPASTGALAAGKVHKVILPELNYASKEWEYTLDNWIPTLPDYRNIYLTELSLPGAWYAGSPEAYQATDNIATLWNAGVRAFSVECRSLSERDGGSYVPKDICISGTGQSAF